MTGNAAILRLLGSTMRIFNDGWNVVFAKKGNLNDAIRDFTSLQPSDVNAIIKDRHLPVSIRYGLYIKRIKLFYVF